MGFSIHFIILRVCSDKLYKNPSLPVIYLDNQPVIITINFKDDPIIPNGPRSSCLQTYTMIQVNSNTTASSKLL